MRAMSHPARMAIIEHLGRGQEATATECAEVVGLSPSATSYHLRALAKAGLIEDAPGRGDGRERVWRAAGRGYTVNLDADADADTRQAEHELIDTFLTWGDTKARHYVARADKEPRDWFDASFFNDALLILTADELRKLGADLHEIISPYRPRTRTDPPPGARSVTIQLRGFPTDEPL